MRLIPNWQNKNNICEICGETRSVKYVHNDKIVCNGCCLKEISKDALNEQQRNIIMKHDSRRTINEHMEDIDLIADLTEMKIKC